MPEPPTPTATPVFEPQDAGARPRSDPHPATITVGVSSDQAWQIDLEELGQLTVELDEASAAWGAVAAICLELALGGGVEQASVQVMAVGRVGEVLERAGLDAITTIPDPDQAISDLEQTVAEQRSELARFGWSLDDTRADPDTRDAWWPRVYVFPPLSDQQLARIAAAIGSGPRTAVSTIVVGGTAEDFAAAAPARALDAPAPAAASSPPRRRVAPEVGAWLVGSAAEAQIAPYGLTVPPVGLTRAGITAITTLLETTGRTDTTPAPWYEPTAAPASNVRPLHPRFPGPVKEVADMGSTGPGVTDFAHPTLLLLGPIQLVGTAGTPPARAERSCIEYCAWLLEHPGSTASEMASALLVAEGTRRSNLSRLRSWLGHSADGTSYLPDGYSGRLFLDPCVSSDWHRLQVLVAPGVARVSSETLTNALHLVRGAPLADAAPGQWHWAEEMRTDMASAVRDIGLVVAERALETGDFQSARWATARALLAAPDDELLLRCRIQAEHLAGNRPEVERLVLRLTRHARRLGLDLDDRTIEVIQEAIEGRPRARA
ncbi:MAG: bacterial transcriptional activator domain-containing protein [Actinomycetia bacterium]|nr:bacterial transcriptional activator domain-containing protein [Actinomycetes bacterium]